MARRDLATAGGSCISILLVEDTDWINSNFGIIADALLPLLKPYESILPDIIMLIDTLTMMTVDEVEHQHGTDLWIVKQHDSYACEPDTWERLGEIEIAGISRRFNHTAGPFMWGGHTREWYGWGVPFYPKRRWPWLTVRQN
jgi:hypothetical protein